MLEQMKPCPKCGKMNNDNWPLDIDDKIQYGGCQDCWETESDEGWWIACRAMDNAIHATEGEV